MDFGWVGKAFWIISAIIVFGAVWYSKRHRTDDPPNKSE
jgi:hypothetical protein